MYFFYSVDAGNLNKFYQTTRCHIPESSIFQHVSMEEVHKLNEIIN